MNEYNPGDLIEFHERSGKEIGIIIRVVRDGMFDDFGVHVRFPDDNEMAYHYYFNELSRWEADNGITVHRANEA
jgi:hypothetical protein